ncbi:hypothetical protein VTL71DRAFT_12314 [Oculimacula yallundae]|uniref:Uncharacterized protein n=1 Tax=Oculimacula yallundae TaxID=86028 RepID=A0ABR4CMA4_9HELO
MAHTSIAFHVSCHSLISISFHSASHTFVQFPVPVSTTIPKLLCAMHHNENAQYAIILHPYATFSPRLLPNAQIIRRSLSHFCLFGPSILSTVLTPSGFEWSNSLPTQQKGLHVMFFSHSNPLV